MESNMQQLRTEEEDERKIARRLFKALCGLYPERYIALVEPHHVATDRPPAPTFNGIESRAVR
jgi:hypothetical protein